MHKFNDRRDPSPQFHRYLSHPARRRPAKATDRDGHGWARLLDHDLRSLKSVQDHARVASLLVTAGEVETLIRVVASGLLNGWARRFYRLALEAWLTQ